MAKEKELPKKEQFELQKRDCFVNVGDMRILLEESVSKRGILLQYLDEPKIHERSVKVFCYLFVK